jgi:hypothetical protein
LCWGQVGTVAQNTVRIFRRILFHPGGTWRGIFYGYFDMSHLHKNSIPGFSHSRIANNQPPPLTNKYQFLFHLQVGLFVRMLAVADCCQIVSSLQPSLVEVSIAHVRRVVSRVLVLYVLQRRSILMLFRFALLFLLIALLNSRVMRLRYNATISPFR